VIDELARVQAETTRLAERLWRRRGRRELSSLNEIRAAISQVYDPGTGTVPGATLPSLGGDLTGRIDAATVVGLQTRPVSSIAPTEGQVPVWDGSAWVPGAPGDASGLILDYSSLVNEALAGSGASASASSFYPGVSGFTSPQPASYLIDNSEITFWETNWGVSGGPFNPVNGAWAKVDLGSAKAITYFRVGILPSNGPPTWKLQSSPDNSTWTDRFSGTGDDDTGIVVIAGGPITARYWRVLATSENGLYPGAPVPWLIRTFALYSGTPVSAAPGHAIQDEGSNRTQRAILNFVGAGVTVTDDSGAGKTVVTIPGGSGHTIEDEGTPLTARSKLNFAGAGVTVSDDSGNDASVVTIPSGAPVDATYVTRTANGTLTSEVLLSAVYAHELKTRWELVVEAGELVWDGADLAYDEVPQ
jgi:hypothetical protein